MKRVAAMLALCLSVLACGLDTVKLQTGVPTMLGSGGEVGCFTSAATGLLMADATYGTTIDDDVMNRVTGTRQPTIPVAWRPGFSARRVGAEIEVLDRSGQVVAVTGRKYTIAGGYVTDGTWSEPKTPMFWACDFVTPLP